MNTNKPLMIEVLPEFSKELKKLLEEDNKFQLAECVHSLHIYEKCDCDEKSCASFYTAPKPNGSYGAGHENLILDADIGWLVLDVVDNEIKFIEILNRPKFRKQLNEIL